jgi:hypothetical protein
MLLIYSATAINPWLCFRYVRPRGAAQKDGARLSYVFSHLPVPTMDAMFQQPADSKPQRPKDHEWCYLRVECGHRCLASRGEVLEDHAHQDYFRFGQHSSRDNQGTSPARLQRFSPGSHIARTQRLMNRVVSSSEHFALTSAERLTRERTERKWASSASPCMME